ncbi:hypothetical protein NHX12_024241 [Muraenolepis orangiensis]|uniref:Tyrosine specific protein phosphatases domain-containing protein n=1 Tax=Muraenolepis orangiensis TaxID=630683 RepID=A0A9Q0ITF6_9TELE|nr:hypothetical protein NHX12_024241 [Muraenolepis orangiensis]
MLIGILVFNKLMSRDGISDESKKQRAGASLWSSCVVLPLLALTWMSAVLAITDRRSMLFQTDFEKDVDMACQTVPWGSLLFITFAVPSVPFQKVMHTRKRHSELYHELNHSSKCQNIDRYSRDPAVVSAFKDWPFRDGAPPCTQFVDDWLNLLKTKFREQPGCCMAVHCVAGLGSEAPTGAPGADHSLLLRSSAISFPKQGLASVEDALQMEEKTYHHKKASIDVD